MKHLRDIVHTRGERAVFRCIRKSPGISRVELCQATDLTSAAVTQIVKRFLAAGVVREDASRSSTEASVGRSRISLSLKDDSYYALGITVRRFDTLWGLVTLDGKVKHFWKDESQSFSNVLANLEKAMNTAATDGQHIMTVGVGLPTFPVPWVGDEDVGSEIAKRIGVPTYAFHNGSYAAYAEEWFMQDLTTENFFYVFFGSGIGGAWVARQGWAPPLITSVETGHVGIDPAGPLCFCGNRGCVELVASPVSLARQHQVPVGDGFQYLKTIDASSKRVAGEALGYGLISIANILNTQTVVLGGYDADLLDTIYGNVLRDYLSHFVTPSGYPLRIITSQLGEFAGIQGAALGALDNVGNYIEAPSIRSSAVDVADRNSQ